MVKAIPAPSLRELSRPLGVTEGVSSDGCSGPVVIHKPLLSLKFLSVYVHRSTLPQSRFRSTAPSEREPGQRPHNANHPSAGYFVSGRVIFMVLCGVMFCHSTGYLRNRKVTGDFHRPYETQKILVFTIHRRTLPQSRSLAVPFIEPYWLSPAGTGIGGCRFGNR